MAAYHPGSATGHIPDDDLERYTMGAVTDERELAPLEEHLLWCHGCLGLVQGTED
jgi:hypothetical protein